MSLRGSIPTLLLAIGLASSASAVEVFRIDSNGDQSDANPGDTFCDTGAGECTLRAAIEEANATSGVDFILVSSSIATDPSGFVRIAPQTALPAITESAIVDFDDAPGYDDLDPWATPIIQIDGSSLVGTEDGIQISGAGAFGTLLDAIAIHGFPRDGIWADTSTAVIQGCHIGLADGQFAAGNGRTGITLAGDDGIIGQSFSASSGWFGKGNVVSANVLRGIFLTGSDTLVAGNRIGTDPLGTSAMGNGNAGVVISGDRTRVGAVDTLTAGGEAASGNLIAASTASGIAVGTSAVDTTIQANLVGTDATGILDLGNLSDGILVSGSRTTVGTLGLGSNVISGNGGYGINVRSTTEVDVFGNLIGISADEMAALPNDDSGILAISSAAIEIEFNVIGGNVGHGVQAHAEQALVNRNVIGTNGNGDDLGNGGDGVHLFAADDSRIGSVSEPPNTIAFNGGHGVFIDGGSTNVTVYGNTIGSWEGGAGAGNGLDGVHVKSSSGVQVALNDIAENGGNGISVDGGAASQGVQIIGNHTFDNAGIGIDLADDGVTPNDPSDGDTGENKLQNAPVLDPALTTYNAGINRIEVRYRVDTDPAEATYPLDIDFYLADASGEEGEVWLVISDSYPASSAGGFRSFSFLPPAGYAYETEMILATAADADLNTSEFGDPVPLPEPGSLLGLACGGGLLAVLVRRRRNARA